MVAPADVEGDVGPLDEAALQQIRGVFATADGLVADVGFDSLLDPTKLVVVLEDGVGDADWARFDIRWFQRGSYSVHHTDERGVDFRFDCHPKPDAPETHFHPPPNAAGDVAPSCITVTEPGLVARAVHRLWRRAYEAGDFDDVNTATDPP